MARTAAVVGGGIGGLAVAIGLRRAGWAVTVFERAPGLPDTGTGLGIWPSALAALDALGVGEEARRRGRPQGGGLIRRPDGSRIAAIDVDRVVRRAGEPVRLLARPDLLDLLAGALPPGLVRFGVRVADPGPLTREFDLVVGADGIHSDMRRALHGDRFPVRYTGVVAWRGTAELDLAAGGETWGRGARFGLTPQGPGVTNWYATLAVAEGYRPPDGDRAVLLRHFGDWHDPIPRLLSGLRDAEILRHDVCDLTPLPGYVTDRVALLGDAAHAMTPDLGQGACQALIDAVTLADCLGAGAPVPVALRTYDRRRRRRTQRLAAMARRVGRLAQAHRYAPARDVLVRLALVVGPPA
ncbi:FAD-dependent monooxygenase [Micromonospora echinofusca]|uniref:NAD(P)-binding protein n=1 Tax=Micromonospora echinofusca TaxID=47858 RepID=A0ABS3VKA3_MICEH|nr:FAD-dependent monooxygenase [Micromonospora echinofusca]MBO4204937.1 NAD(P)-binding protein [Micromonospora echinofusca]